MPHPYYIPPAHPPHRWVTEQVSGIHGRVRRIELEAGWIEQQGAVAGGGVFTEADGQATHAPVELSEGERIGFGVVMEEAVGKSIR